MRTMQRACQGTSKGIHAYHWAAKLESAASVPGWLCSPAGDADCIAYLEAKAAYLRSGDLVDHRTGFHS